MQAMVIRHSHGGRVLAQAEVEEPRPGPGQVLIEVHSTSVNRADLLALAGSYSAAGAGSGPVIAGLDASGVVVGVGPGVEASVGDRVMTMVAGGLAERVVVDARMPLTLPADWSFDEGAAAVLALMTAHDALATAGRLRRGEAVFVNAANSGVGRTAVQVARLLGAGRVLAGVRRRRADDVVLALGADAVVDTSEADVAGRVRAANDGRGVDVVVDHVGGPYLTQNLEALAVRGRLVSVGRLGGGQVTLDLDLLALQRVELVGVTFRTRDADEKAELVARVRHDLGAALSEGALRPRIDRVVPWTEVGAALEAVGSDAVLGKVVLQVRAS